MPKIEHMNCCTHSLPDIVPPIINHEAALCTFNYQPFEIGRNDAQKNSLIQSWEAALSAERAPITAEIATAVHEEAPGDLENRPIERRRTKNGFAVEREVKSVVKQLGPKRLLGKCFDSDAAADSLSKRLLASCLFMEDIAFS